jgi:DNA-binding CsgD family transcriptional regulator
MSRVPSATILVLMQAFGAKHGLTHRETQVLVRFAEGYCRKEAAYLLGCSAGTINTHWRRILARMQVDSPERVLALLITFLATEAPSTESPAGSGGRNTASPPHDRPASHDGQRDEPPWILRRVFRTSPANASTLALLRNLVRSLRGVMPASGSVRSQP